MFAAVQTRSLRRQLEDLRQKLVVSVIEGNKKVLSDVTTLDVRHGGIRAN